MEEATWGNPLLDLAVEPSAIDDRDQEDTSSAHTYFPVRRNSQDPELLIVLPLLDERNPKDGQQPTRSSTCTGQLDSRLETSSQWHGSVQEPIEISAVEEEGVEQFVDTPWTIARRLAQANKNKPSHRDFGPKFALKLPSDGAAASSTLQRGDRGIPPRSLAFQHDLFPSNAQLLPPAPVSPHIETIQPDKFECQRSPDWSTVHHVDGYSRPTSYSENVTEYPSIQNTTSAIDGFPHLTSSTIQGVDDGLDPYRPTDFDEENNSEELYGEDDAGLEHKFYNHHSSVDFFPEEQEFEINDDPEYESIDDACAQQSTQLPGLFWNQNQWDEDHINQENFDPGPHSRGALAQTDFNEFSSYSTDTYQPAQTEYSPQKHSSKVGRLSGYKKKHATRLPRVPAYARGSSSARIPPEVYHFKTDQNHKSPKDKQSFRDRVKDSKYQRPAQKKFTPPIARGGAKLAALYEPSSTMGDFHRKYSPSNEAKVALQLPTIRSRAIKPATACLSSAGVSEKTSKFDSHRKYSGKSLNHSTRPNTNGVQIQSFESKQKNSAMKTTRDHPESTGTSGSDDDVTIISASPKNNEHKKLVRSRLDFEQFSQVEDETESDDIEILEEPKNLHQKKKMSHQKKMLHQKFENKAKNLDFEQFSQVEDETESDDIEIIEEPKNLHQKKKMSHQKKMLHQKFENKAKNLDFEQFSQVEDETESDDIEILEEPKNLHQKKMSHQKKMLHQKFENKAKNEQQTIFETENFNHQNRFGSFSDLNEIDEEVMKEENLHKQGVYKFNPFDKTDKGKEVFEENLLASSKSFSRHHDRSSLGTSDFHKEKNRAGVIMECNFLKHLSVNRCRQVNRLLEAQVAMKRVWLL